MISQPKLIILGAGGQGDDLAEMVSMMRTFEVVGFLDMYADKKKEFFGLPVLGDESLLPEMRDQGIDNVFITYGWVRHINIRRERFQQCAELGLKLPTIIHPSAVVHPSAKIGPGCFIFANAIVGSATVLGTGVNVNANAVVSHGTHVGDFTTLSPGAKLSSNARIGKGCVVFMNASVGSQVKLPDDSIVEPNQSIRDNF